MPHYGYLVVEGHHDVEFVYRLLRPAGFRRVRFYNQLDPFWDKLVPKTFPYQDDLQKRVPVPLFVANDTHSIALHAAMGESRVTQAIQETVRILPSGSLASVGIILDADYARTADQLFEGVNQEMARIGVPLPDRAGDVRTGPPATGAFILPDNSSAGTLETLLVECANIQYPQLLTVARIYLQSVDESQLTADDLKEVRKPAGPDKTVVNSIASVLKPGKAIQTSIQDNRWLRGQALNLPRVAAVGQFLKRLFSLP